MLVLSVAACSMLVHPASAGAGLAHQPRRVGAPPYKLYGKTLRSVAAAQSPWPPPGSPQFAGVRDAWRDARRQKQHSVRRQTMAPEPFCTLRPNTRNGPALVLLSGVLFSGGGILYRSTSLNREKPVAAEWRYLSYRFIALTSAALLWIGISSACFSRSWPPLRSVSGSRWRRSAVGGLLMTMCNVCFIVALQRIDVATTLRG